MASRNNRRASSRRAPEPVHRSDSEDIISEEVNNRRLRQAISYIATEGGSDTSALYANRVQKIDDSILQQYAERGYLFDPKLYRQLRAMVREVQTGFRRIGEEDEILEDSEDVEQLEQKALLREEDDLQDQPGSDLHSYASSSDANSYGSEIQDDIPYNSEYRQQKRDGKAPTGQAKPPGHRPTAIPAPVRATAAEDTGPWEMQWRYGGPKNDMEEHHKNFPASLPFGETLYMQQWESMKIHYDLKQSAARKPNDPPIFTNVGYDKVRLPTSKTPFDSGSRFKLPEAKPEFTKWLDTQGAGLLKSAAGSFNSGGAHDSHADNDYAPRIFLEQLIPNPDPQSFRSSARPRSASVNAEKGVLGSTGASGTGQSPSTRPILASRDTIRHSSGQATKTFRPAGDVDEIAAEVQTKNPSRRAADASPPKASRARTTATPEYPPPVIRILDHVAPVPAVPRALGRPRKPTTPASTPTATPTPAPAPSLPATRSSKRKMSEGSKPFLPIKKISRGKTVTFSDTDEEFSDDQDSDPKHASKSRRTKK
ncbi:hypothetical protein K505DRAFT_4564 [Melanomma pulvis-pyrius CBS 109.77]|uniref:Uncharacterized protein n=1 Tax=Melanomma pulvis-pyrius CBS 109.77 TaxID=1314802 RepID=A0A6A6XI21_9PLEO|nr:hypothetical protein K505DRAFT_4564 [Melanomma pulvis-pyrius CBS 109.77]